MKYRLCCLLVAISATAIINAQTIQWMATGAGDSPYTTHNNAYAVESTSDYIYVSGYADGSNVYINDTTISHGDFSFLAQFDKEGNLRWIRENVGEEANDVAVNSKNEAYTIYTTWNSRNHILKYDQNGLLLWDKEFIQFDMIKAIAVDKNDNLLVTGNYFTDRDSLVIEDTVIHNLKSWRVNSFVLKYDSEGEFKWFNTTNVNPMECYIYLNDIQPDDNGNAYVTGYYELLNEDDSLQFGNFYLNSESDPKYSSDYYMNTDIVLAKLSPEGDVLWAKGYGGYKDDRGIKLALNASGDVFMTGVYDDTVYFSNFKSALYGSHIFLCKLNTEGSVEWANQIASNSLNKDEQGNALAVDDNYIYVGGIYRGSWAVYGSMHREDTVINFRDFIHHGFLVKYSRRGDFISANHIVSEQASIHDISMEGDSLYIAGNALPPATFYNFPIPVVSNNNNNHFFLASIQDKVVSGNSDFKVSDISYYPNPANSYIVIQSKNQERIIGITFLDLKGNTLIANRNPGITCRIDISSLPAGIYILKIQTSNGFEVKKLVKADL